MSHRQLLPASLRLEFSAEFYSACQVPTLAAYFDALIPKHFELFVSGKGMYHPKRHAHVLRAISYLITYVFREDSRFVVPDMESVPMSVGMALKPQRQEYFFGYFIGPESDRGGSGEGDPWSW